MHACFRAAVPVGACGYVRVHADDNRADQVFAPVVFVKFTRSVAISEPELTEVGAYLQRSCFVVGDHRLALAHRAMAGTQPGLLRFGRVLFWVRQSPKGPPLRAVVHLFDYLPTSDIDALLHTLPRNLGQRVWRPKHMINVHRFTKISIPVEFCTRGTVIAMHVQGKARGLGLAFCMPSLPREH